MTPKLSEEQQLALKQQPGQPVQVEDPETRRQYVLIQLDVYEQMRNVARGTEAATDQEREQASSPGTAAALPEWCNVYQGPSEEEIADLEELILPRADLTRPS
jgi:hypothetical protein